MLAGVVALAAFVGVAAAAAPVVSAGLDQNVVEGDTVYLDGGGTHVPDGKLAELEWTIETPGGATLYPACRRSRRPASTVKRRRSRRPRPGSTT